MATRGYHGTINKDLDGSRLRARPPAARPNIPTSAALAAFLLMSAGPFAGAAFADGIVVRSTAPAYARGDAIAAGAAIQLVPGERIMVLDETGETTTFETSGVYGAASVQRVAAERQKIDILRAAVWGERRSAAGATRASEFETCMAMPNPAAYGPAASRLDCERAFPGQAPHPTFDVKLASGGATLSAGAPMLLRISTNFEAAVTCAIGDARDASGAYALELEPGSSWVSLKPGETLDAPRSPSTPLTAPRSRGDYVLTCVAIDAASWRVVREAAPVAPPDDLVRLAEGYARIRKSPALTATINLAIRR